MCINGGMPCHKSLPFSAIYIQAGRNTFMHGKGSHVVHPGPRKPKHASPLRIGGFCTLVCNRKMPWKTSTCLPMLAQKLWVGCTSSCTTIFGVNFIGDSLDIFGKTWPMLSVPRTTSHWPVQLWMPCAWLGRVIDSKHRVAAVTRAFGTGLWHFIIEVNGDSWYSKTPDKAMSTDLPGIVVILIEIVIMWSQFGHSVDLRLGHKWN